MPLYEYECECGKKLEALKSIEERHNVVCECGNLPELKVSCFMLRIADYFTTIGHDGTVLGRRQTTEKTPMKVRKNTGRIINL